MLPVELISASIAVLGNLFLGLFTIRKNPKSATSKLFFLFTSVLALYIGFNFLATHQTTNFGAYLWVHVVMTNAVAINLFFFLLVDTFPQPRMHMRPFILWASIATSLLMVPITTTNLIFHSVTIQHGAVMSLPGIGMPAFLLHTLVFLGGGFLLLVQRFRKAKGIEKAQLRFFLAGTIFMFVSLIVTNIVFVVVFNNSAFVGLLPLYTLMFVGCISYAIVRHRFLDINFLVARAVVYTILIALISFMFSVGVYVLSRVFLQIHFSTSEQLVLIGITIGITLAFQYTRQVVERITDRLFFQGRYTTNDVLGSLTYVMASTLRLEDLTHGLLDILLHELRVSKGAFLLVREGLVADVMSQGYKPFPTLVESDVKVLAATRTLLNIDDTEEGELKNILRSLDVSIVVHMRTEGTQIGMLLLGAKSSGDIYSAQDIALLELLAPEAAIALQNAFAYEEIRRFTITLQEEVARATADLTSANERLQELDKLKDEFVSLASHELRTPLTAIRSYIWMALSGKGGSVNEKQRYYLDRAFTSSNRLIKLVNDMLNISRIESGRMAMQMSRVSVAKLIQNVLDEIQPKIMELGLIMTVSIEEIMPDVIADLDKVEEVLINFLGNAMKFTPRGGRIRINVTKDESFVRVSVTDTGIGIEAKDLRILFTKFGTIRSGATPDSIAVQSTGLGLYISKSIISMHGGVVKAVSPGLGKGATFSFTLPLYTENLLSKMQHQYANEGLGMIHSTLD